MGFIYTPMARLTLNPTSLHISHTTSTTMTSTIPAGHPKSNSLEIIGARESVLSHFPSLQRPYNSFPIIASNHHIETIFAAFCRSVPSVALRRECLRTRDEGAVALDWVSGDDRRLPPESPLLILLPGLTGGSGDSYVRHMLVRARSRGWRVVVLNSRGCADSPVTTPQFYSATFTEDLRQVVKQIGSRYPKSNLYAIGWSLGANILVRYLGQIISNNERRFNECRIDPDAKSWDDRSTKGAAMMNGGPSGPHRAGLHMQSACRRHSHPRQCESNASPLSGAVSLCNPFDLVLADEDFRKGFNIIYDKALGRALCKILKKHALLFEGMEGEYNIPLAANAKSVREFDEGLTRVSFGYKSVDDYYSTSSSSHSIKDVCTPLLCIQAANDPIAPARGIPRDDIKENPHCLLIVTPKGGHLGWVAGDEAPFGAPWTDTVVMEYLEHLEKQKPESTSCGQSDGVQQLEEALFNVEA